MDRIANAIAAATLSLGAIAAAPAAASPFQAWEVTGVGWGDILNVRRWPASHSAKQAGYPNGTILSMTGKCKGLNLDDIAHLSPKQQRKAVRYTWCELWHDPDGDGDYTVGWVYMKYMRPM